MHMVLLKQLLALVLPAVASHLHWSAEQGPAPYPVAQGSVTAAPFSGIPRQHILNVPATPNLTAYSAATGAIYTGSNGRCRRAIRHHPQSCRLILKHCAGYGHGVVDYVDLYYCRYTAHRATVLALISAWLALLFVWLGVSASEYFSPNISFLAQLMRLPESLAGVTLLALGNGAPDLFSTFSAVRAGSGALALGQLIGSASFIVSVVVGATTLVVPVYRVSQLSYLRELFFFAATIGMVAVIVLSERLSRGLAMCMVGLYGAYVVTVMVTTYYEEQSLAPESPVDGISSNPAVPVQADRPADGVYPEPSPRDIQPSGDRQWDGVASARLEQRQQSQGTSCGIDFSVRALGEFLHHHPKSLLAAAECSDIFDEIRVPQSHRGTLALEPHAWPHLNMARSSTAEHQLGFLSQPSTGASPIWPPTRPPLCMPNLAPPSTEQTDSNSAPSVRAESSTSLYNCSQFPPGQSAFLLPSPSNVAVEAMHVPPERHSQESSAVVVDTPQQTQGLAHSSTCLPTIEVSLATFLPLPIALASTSRIDMLAGSHQSPSLLAAASPWSKAPGSTAPYLAPVSGAPVAKISKAQAVVYICVPTLRHWRPEASSYLKLFIAFSALPVLLLSVTVPVLACLPEPKEGASDFRELGASSEDDDSIGNDYCSSQLHSTATSRELERWERHAEPDGPDTHLSLHIHRPPTERASLSRPSSLHMALDDLANGHSVQALNAATIAWAEKVVSSVRSFMSAAFLYSVLGLGGYFALDTGQATSVLLGLALATTSLLGNHFSRRAQQRHYWLQVAPCFFGFVCGLAWIYIIANEVVSITQALGLILGLSEEILGLTVVGFGNSLGDLVTNLTLTRMGYPMMALSACFGGPMLCLLIGVGVAAYGIMAGSGPDDDGMYHMPITSPTVLVSTACLLLNSLIYLVAIPRLNYHMTRAVGLAVLAVYFTGMAVNIYLEW